MLPHEDDKWSYEDQQAWLHVAEVNFAYLYGGPQQTSTAADMHKNESRSEKTPTAAASADANDDEEQQPF
jgi:hypothetical protein